MTYTENILINFLMSSIHEHIFSRRKPGQLSKRMHRNLNLQNYVGLKLLTHNQTISHMTRRNQIKRVRRGYDQARIGSVCRNW